MCKRNLQTTTAATTLSAGRVGGDGGDILNATDLDARTCQSTESRLSAGAGSLGTVATGGTELDVKGIDTQLFATDSNVLCGKHGSVRGGLISISLDLHAPSDAHQGFFAREIGDMDKCVVERGEDVGNTPNQLSFPANEGNMG